MMMTKKELLEELKNLPNDALIMIGDMYGNNFKYELSVHDSAAYEDHEKQAEFILGIYINDYTEEM